MPGEIPIITDIFEAAGRILGKSWGKSGPQYGGRFGSPGFFNALRADDEKALRTLEKKGYGSVWKRSSLKGPIEREIIRDADRYTNAFTLKKVVPRGVLTGRPMYGLNRGWSNLTGTALKLGLGIGGAVTLLQAATAPRGQIIKRAVTGTGATVGGMVGAAAGAALLGLPGEIVGGYLGGVLGEKAAAPVELWQRAQAQSRYLNFGAGYQDTQQAYTQRQRAVQ